MAIKTLYSEGIRFPRLGIIRLGVKVSGRKRDGTPFERPAEVDYFVLPPQLRDAFAAQGLSDKPKVLDIAFPWDDLDVVYPMWFQKYEGALLAARCDGETCAMIDKAGAETVMPCGRKEHEAKCGACGARALGRLNVLVRQSPTVGIFQIIIGGFARNRDLMTEIQMAQGSLAHAGVKLSGAWLRLERIESTVQIKTDKGRISRKDYPVRLVIPFSPDALMGRMGPAALAPADTTGSAIESRMAAFSDEVRAKMQPAKERVQRALGAVLAAAQAGDNGAPEDLEPSDVAFGRLMDDEEPSDEAAADESSTPSRAEIATEGGVVGKLDGSDAQLDTPTVAEARLGPQAEPRPQETHEFDSHAAGPATPAGDAWDSSMLISRGVKILSLTARQMTAYLEAVFGGPDSMDEAMISDVQAGLEAASRDGEANRLMRQGVFLALSRRDKTKKG